VHAGGFLVMANESMRSNGLQNLQSQVKQDLLESYLYSLGVSFKDTDEISEIELEKLITLSKDGSYPWLPASPAGEEMLNTLEQEFTLDDWQPEEVAQQSQAFFNQIDALWNQVPLQVTLAQRFAAIPQELVATITQKAQQIFSSSLSLADQLVQCAQAIQINLAEEDLQLLARPYAYAMRGAAPELQVKTDWKELSEPERARLALEIARYAIDELTIRADS
jgi:hypothetical protein